MSIQTLLFCNKCGKHTETEHEFTLFKERLPDAAGGMEDWVYRWHLCDECLAALFRRLLHERVLSDFDLFEGFKDKPEVV